MEFKNDLDLVGKIAAHSVMSGKYKDKDGNIKEILPVGPGNSLDFDQFREDIGAFGGGSGTGGNTQPDDGTDTSGGVNTVPGRLSDGSLCERYLEWQGTTSTTDVNTIQFDDDVGTSLNRIGDGLQFSGHLEKVSVNNGTKNTATSIPLKYDPKNVKDAGYFVTTSPIPFSINRSNFTVGKKITVTLNGIGEGFSGTKKVLAPTVSFTFNSDKSMKVEVTQGYYLDGNVEGNTGAFYTYVLDMVNTYSVQAPIAQLPNGMTLMTGNARGEIALNGVGEGFNNVGGGIKITIDPNITVLRYWNSNLGLTESSNGSWVKYADFNFKTPLSFIVKKENLIAGLSTDKIISSMSLADIGKIKYTQSNGSSFAFDNGGGSIDFNSNGSIFGSDYAVHPQFEIGNGTIVNNSVMFISSDSANKFVWGLSIDKIESYTEV